MELWNKAVLHFRGLFKGPILSQKSSAEAKEPWSNLYVYTDLVISNFREEKLCVKTVMYIFEVNFHME